MLKTIRERKKDPIDFIKKKILSGSKPKRLNKLQNAIQSWMKIEEISLTEEWIESLKTSKFLTIDEQGKVVYFNEND